MRRFAILIVPVVLAACGSDDKAAKAPAAPKPSTAIALETGVPVQTTGTGGQTRTSGLPDVSKLKDLPAPSGVAAPSACASAGIAPTPANLRQVSSVILCLHNAERKARGLRPLKFNARLARAAGSHTRNMVARKFFAHDAPGGGNVASRARSAGYINNRVRWTVGENLAFGGGGLAAPGKIMASWMGSAAHRANILTRGFREIGIGVAAGSPRGGDGFTYTAVFGAKSR